MSDHHQIDTLEMQIRELNLVIEEQQRILCHMHDDLEKLELDLAAARQIRERSLQKQVSWGRSISRTNPDPEH
jgi:hypothetical protein